MDILRNLVFGLSLSCCILLWRVFVSLLITVFTFPQRLRTAGIRVAIGECGSFILLLVIGASLLVPMLMWSMQDRLERYSLIPFIIGFAFGLGLIGKLIEFLLMTIGQKQSQPQPKE